MGKLITAVAITIGLTWGAMSAIPSYDSAHNTYSARIQTHMNQR
jgi:hypothetical protein